MTCDCLECPSCGRKAHEPASLGYVVGLLMGPLLGVVAVGTLFTTGFIGEPAAAFGGGAVLGAGYVLLRTDPHLFDPRDRDGWPRDD